MKIKKILIYLSFIFSVPLGITNLTLAVQNSKRKIKSSKNATKNKPQSQTQSIIKKDTTKHNEELKSFLENIEKLSKKKPTKNSCFRDFKFIIDTTLKYIDLVKDLSVEELEKYIAIFKSKLKLVDLANKEQPLSDNESNEAENLKQFLITEQSARKEITKKLGLPEGNIGKLNSWAETFKSSKLLKFLPHQESKNDIIDNLKLKNIYELYVNIAESALNSATKSRSHIRQNSNDNYILEAGNSNLSIILISFNQEDLNKILENPLYYLKAGLLSNKPDSLPSLESYLCSILGTKLNGDQKDQDIARNFLQTIIERVKKEYNLTSCYTENLKSLSFFEDNAKQKPNDLVILDSNNLIKSKIYNFLKRCAHMFHYYNKYYLVVIVVNWNHIKGPEFKLKYDETSSTHTLSSTGWHYNIEKQSNTELDVPIKGDLCTNAKTCFSSSCILHNTTNDVKRLTYVPIKEIDLSINGNDLKFSIKPKQSDQFPCNLASDEQSIIKLVIRCLLNTLQNNSYCSENSSIQAIGKIEQSGNDFSVNYFLERNSIYPEVYTIKTMYPCAIMFYIENVSDISKINTNSFQPQNFQLETFIQPNNSIEKFILYNYLKAKLQTDNVIDVKFIDDIIKEVNRTQNKKHLRSISEKIIKSGKFDAISSEQKKSIEEEIEEEQKGKNIKLSKIEYIVKFLSKVKERNTTNDNKDLLKKLEQLLQIEPNFDGHVNSKILKNGDMVTSVSPQSLNYRYSILTQANVLQELVDKLKSE